MADVVLGVDCSTTASRWSPGTATARRSVRAARTWRRSTLGRCSASSGPRASGRRPGRHRQAHAVDRGRPGGRDLHHPPARVVRPGQRGQPRPVQRDPVGRRAPEAQLAELGERFGHDELHRRTGRGPSLTQSFSKILWLVQNHPDIARDAHKFMDVHGFLVQRLTGKFTTSLASADSFGLIDAEHDTWADDLITGIGLRPEQFCDTVRPGEVIGEVTAEAAKATGLPAGIPVVAGLGDGQAACLGAGVTSLDRAYFNLGTAVTGGRSSASTSPTRPAGPCTAAPGTYLLESVLRRRHHDLVHAQLRRHLDAKATSTAMRPRPASRPGAGIGPGAYWNAVMNPYYDNAASGMIVGWRQKHGRDVPRGRGGHLLRVQAGHGGHPGRQRRAHQRVRHPRRRLQQRPVVPDRGRHPRRHRHPSPHRRGDQPGRILGAYGVGWYPSVEEAASAMTDTAESFKPRRQGQHAVRPPVRGGLPAAVPRRPARCGARRSCERS